MTGYPDEPPPLQIVEAATSPARTSDSVRWVSPTPSASFPAIRRPSDRYRGPGTAGPGTAGTGERASRPDIESLARSHRDLLAMLIVASIAYKGSQGKTTLIYELMALLNGILIDFEHDDGSASLKFGYDPNRRLTAPLIDALRTGRPRFPSKAVRSGRTWSPAIRRWPLRSSQPNGSRNACSSGRNSGAASSESMRTRAEPR